MIFHIHVYLLFLFLFPFIYNTCKVVILGSNKQIDNFYVNKHTNSLTTLLKSTKDENSLVNTFAIKLRKVLRGPITEWAEMIFSK